MDILTRRNTVLEALRGNRRQLYRLWVQKGMDRKLVRPIVEAAKERGIPVQELAKQKMSQIAKDSRHQGVVLEAGDYLYAEVDEILGLAQKRGERPFILLLDLLHGPQNIGSLLRTAEICGVHGIIVQDRRAPDITPVVAQYSVGATEHLLVAQVTNLVNTIEQLKAAGVWIVGMDMGGDARPLAQVDLDIPVGIVVGHEGDGIRRLVSKHCDILLELPMRGHVESLNAAVAGSVLLYMAWQARGYT